MKRAGAVGAMCAVFLVAPGCGGVTSHPPDAKPSAAQPSQSSVKAGPSGTPKPARPGEPDSGGKMVPRYDDAETPEAQQGRQLMMDAKFLEDVSQQVNDLLNLPFDVPVIGKQCGDANAFWDPSAREISMCYEDIEHSDKMFTTANDPNPVQAAVDSEISTFYHELGHATLAIYELPFTGREEDVADQLSAFMLLSPGADGKPYPNGVRIATNAARMWKLNSHEAGDANDLPFWDTHSFDLTRMYNWECWIYGSDPAGDGNIVASGDLPEDRAGGCQEEFSKMSEAWQQMLGPHLKKPG
jgi:hypothetical protein